MPDSEVQSYIQVKLDEKRDLDDPVLAFGFYTPTSSGEANLKGVTPTEAQWARVGAIVTVSGRIDVNVQDPDTETLFELDLPVASVISNVWFVAGVCYDASIRTTGGEVYGNTSNNTAQFRIVVRDDGSALEAPYSYIFQYRIAT